MPNWSLTADQGPVRKRWALVGAVFSTTFLMSCSVTDAEPVPVAQFTLNAAERTLVSSCSPNELLAQPAELDLSCATVSAHLDSLSWQQWGSGTTTAAGNATLYANCADLDCPRDFSAQQIPVHVTATDIIQHTVTVENSPLVSQYTTLHIQFNGTTPTGVPQTLTFNAPHRISTGNTTATDSPEHDPLPTPDHNIPTDLVFPPSAPPTTHTSTAARSTKD